MKNHPLLNNKRYSISDLQETLEFNSLLSKEDPFEKDFMRKIKLEKILPQAFDRVVKNSKLQGAKDHKVQKLKEIDR